MSIATTITYSGSIPDQIKKYELTNGSDFTTSAKSAESGLYKLFDNNLDTYYQTSSSCPHTVTFTFAKPVAITCFADYRNSSDSSYCPDRNSFVLTLTNGKTLTAKDQMFKKSTDWVIVEFIKCPRITKLMYSIDKNHSSGCDSRVRQIKLFSKVSFQEMDPLVHRKMLIADVYHQLPVSFESDENTFKDTEKVISQAYDKVNTDVVLESSDGKFFQAHAFVCGMLSKNLYESIITSKQMKCGMYICKLEDVKAMFLRAILNFGYGNMKAFSDILDEIEKVRPEKENTNSQSPESENPEKKHTSTLKEDLHNVFGELVEFLDISVKYSMLLLSDQIESRMVSIIESGILRHHQKSNNRSVRLNSNVFKYIGDITICPKTLLYKFTNFLSKRPDLLSDKLISMLTKTELASLISIGSVRVKNPEEEVEGKYKQAFEDIFRNSELKEKNITFTHDGKEMKTTGTILTLKPGCKVRMREGVSSFYFGRGNINPSDVGTVVSISEDGIVHVDFQKGDGKMWRGLLDEVEEA